MDFLPDEMIRVEMSQKVRICASFIATPPDANCALYQYSDKHAYTLFSEANLRPIHRWTDSARNYSLWLLERPLLTFPVLAPVVKAESGQRASTPFGLPTVEEWRDMWNAWDYINQRMIPASMLFEKPIDLRHICLFYQGHIPTFLDIHLSRLLKEPHTDPQEYKVR